MRRLVTLSHFTIGLCKTSDARAQNVTQLLMQSVYRGETGAIIERHTIFDAQMNALFMQKYRSTRLKIEIFRFHLHANLTEI